MKNLRIHELSQLTTLCLLVLFLAAEAAAQSAYTDGKTAQLKSSHINKLKALRAPIAIPTYIPAGYKLKGIGASTSKLRNFWIVDYGLSYENAKGDSFDIDSANEGLGDLPITGVLDGKNPFFEGEIDVGTQGDIENGETGIKLKYESGWIRNKRTYVPAGAHSRSQSYRLNSTALSPKEVLKVMLSLRYLR